MSSHFDKMEHELDLLSHNMELITNKSNEITKNLGGKREELDRMSTTHSLLNKIQFILHLPDTIKTLVNDNNLTGAVDHYLEAKPALDLYSHFSSIKNIQFECAEMLDIIKQQLYARLLDEEVSNRNNKKFILSSFILKAETDQIHASVEYLIKLNENPSTLCDMFFQMFVYIFIFHFQEE